MKNDFYIGYADSAPKGMKRTARVIYAVVLALLSYLSVRIAYNHMYVSNFEHEFGKETTLEGTYLNTPYPMLEMDYKGVKKQILLVGMGKHGLSTDINEGSKIEATGYLVYGDGKTLLQVTKDIGLNANLKAGNYTRSRELLADAEYVGMIIDPLCYFGVMKPGQGKIHRSCAVRCISGGIPPVLRIQSESGSNKYLLVEVSDQVGLEDLLPYVGRPIRVSGQESDLGDWHAISVTDIAYLKDNIIEN